MYNFDGKYSIENAPAHLLNMAIKPETGEFKGRLVRQKNAPLKFELQTMIYIPNYVDFSYLAAYLTVYSDGLANDIYLNQQKAELTALDDSVVDIVFPIEISDDLLDGVSGVNVQLALSNKHENEMGISESLRIGRFLNTLIPLGANNNVR